MKSQRYYGRGWDAVKFEDKHICEIHEDKVVVYVRDENSDSIIFCKEGFEKVKKLNRSIVIVNGYAVVTVDKKLKKLHRVLMDAQKGICIDHINRNRLDNRLNNLRIVNHRQNGQNKSEKSTNSSGHRNVTWQKHAKSWRVALTVEGRFTHIGNFKELQDAVDAAREARLKYMPFSECDL